MGKLVIDLEAHPPQCTGIELYEDGLKDSKAFLKGRAQLEKATKQFAGRRKARSEEHTSELQSP